MIEADRHHIVLTHEVSPSRPLRYAGKEVIADGYRAVWFLFKDEPFDVGRFYRPDGSWTGYYADVLAPVRWEDADPHTLEPLVDLFLDLWIAPDGGYKVLDEDEFDRAVASDALPPEQAELARAVLARLVAETAGGRFPPDMVRDFRP